MDSYSKYLKYKKKYLDLQNLIGGKSWRSGLDKNELAKILAATERLPDDEKNRLRIKMAAEIIERKKEERKQKKAAEQKNIHLERERIEIDKKAREIATRERERNRQKERETEEKEEEEKYRALEKKERELTESERVERKVRETIERAERAQRDEAERAEREKIAAKEGRDFPSFKQSNQITNNIQEDMLIKNLKVLGLTLETANKDSIKKQYRRLALMYHPDKSDTESDSKELEKNLEKFKKITNANEYLKNFPDFK